MRRRDLPLAALLAALCVLLLVGIDRSGVQNFEDQNAPQAPPPRLVAGPAAVYRLGDFAVEPRRESHPVRKGAPVRFAEAERVVITPQSHGQWESGAGIDRWTLAVEAPGALNLNFGFSSFTLPESGQLEFRTRDGELLARPFTAADNEAHGQLWTPVFAGEEVEMILTVAAKERPRVKLEIGAINRGFRSMAMAAGNAKLGTAPTLGDCHIDVVCSAAESGVGPAIDQYRDPIRSAGAYTLFGIDSCSGSLVNNTAFDGTPYVVLAHHCGVREGNAPSLVMYWKFQNSTCRPPGSAASLGDGDGPLTLFNTGATFRATQEESDFTLVELDDPIPPAADPFYAGWSRSNTPPTMGVVVHHPNLSEKRISFEFDDLRSTDVDSTTIDSDAFYWRVRDWDHGSTEGGSSGGPLFDQNGRMVGHLFGGDALCDNDQSDWFGKFGKAWAGGGTPETRLSDWLDPLGTSPTAIDGTDTPAVLVSISDVEMIEGDSGTTQMEFMVELSRAATELIEVQYSTQDGTASAGSDFTAIPNTTLSFAIGETAKMVSVDVTGDTSPEDHEQFTVQLSLVGSPYAYIPDPIGSGTILNDDYEVPVIAAPAPVNGEITSLVSTTISATNTPTSFTLSSAPAGMTIDDSGFIRWVPTATGSFSVTVIASNPAGSNSETVVFTISGNLLAQGVEAEGQALALSTGGDAPWVRNGTANSINGNDRAQSGDIDDNEVSWLEATFEGPDVLGFWWDVNSESGFDQLTLEVDSEPRARISGNRGWEYRVVAVGPGTHRVRWVFAKDPSTSEGTDHGRVDLIRLASETRPFLMEPPVVFAARNQPVDYQFPSATMLATAMPVAIDGAVTVNAAGEVTGTPTVLGETPFTLTLNEDGNTLSVPASLVVREAATVGAAAGEPNLLWLESGDGTWNSNGVTSLDGQSAKESGVSDLERGELSAVVFGPGQLSFWWKVSSEYSFDFFLFEVDGALQEFISGEVEWREVTLDLGYGAHVLTWAYAKDESAEDGDDTAWLDRVELAGYAGWLEDSGPTGRGNGVFDLDRDEQSQFFEFATGGARDAYDLMPAPALVGAVLEWSVSKPAGVRDVAYDAEVSGDLAVWSRDDCIILQDDAVQFRAQDKVSGEPGRHIRGMVSPTR